MNSIASSPYREADVRNLLKEVDSYGQALLQGQDVAVRVSLIARARALIASLETPMESVTWMAWAEVR